MSKVLFKNPWFLFALIPLVAVSLLSFFLVNKRFRYKRQKVASLVMGIIIAINASLLLAGMSVKKVEKNAKNEVLFLVDASASMKHKKEEVKQRIKDIMDSTPENVKFGLSIFGNDYRNLAKIGSDRDEILQRLDSDYELSDNTTNLEKAFQEGTKEFKSLANGKVLMMTDGLETDGSIYSVMSTYLGKGLKLDVSIINSNYSGEETAITGVREPNNLVKINEINRYQVRVRSRSKTIATLKVYDNGILKYKKGVTTVPGDNLFDVDLTFTNKGLHRLKFEIETTEDNVDENNVYLVCTNIQDVNKLLIVNKNGDGKELNSIFSGYAEVKTLQVKDLPNDIDALREYDQIVLNNISNADMPSDVIKNISTYVKKYGGGLLTLGGTKRVGGEDKPNTYVKEDMQGSLYQSLLPVECEEYKPPIAVTIVIDISGSMLNQDPNSGRKLIDIAKEQAIAAIKALDERDYVGVVTFGSKSTVVIEPTPLTKRQRVIDAVEGIEGKLESSIYSNGVERAGLTLRSVTHVSKKHILFISDGAPGSGDSTYVAKTAANRANGISTSTIGFGSNVNSLRNMAIAGGGKYYYSRKTSDLSLKIKEDLQSEFIREYDATKNFKPEIPTVHEITKDVNESELPELNNFFGTRLKQGATSILSGEYGQPILSTHNVGRGKVSSLMTNFKNLEGTDWLNSEAGKKLFKSLIEYGFPNKSIKKNKVDVNIKQQNYTLGVNVFSKVKEGTVEYKVYRFANNEWEEIESSSLDFEGSEKFTTELVDKGIYKLEVSVTNKNGKVEKTVLYQAISYSSEYSFRDYPDSVDNVNKLADFEEAIAKNGGRMLDEKMNISDNLQLINEKYIDLRVVLGVLIIIAFIIDLAVRKFKWKLISEIIKERKDAKSRK